MPRSFPVPSTIRGASGLFVLIGALLLLMGTLGAPSARAAVTSTVSATVLTVTADADDTIRITCGGDGEVKVNEQDPTGEPRTCSSITQVQATATGAFTNTIDLTGLTPQSFPALARITVDAGSGDDSIQGGPIGEDLRGGDGDDSILGGPGNDDLSGGSGSDVLEGGPGDDSLRDTDPAGVDELSGGPGDDDITGGTGLERVVQVADVDQVLTDARLTGVGTDSLLGMDEARLTGGGGDNHLDASLFTAGPVVLEGAGGSDTLRGGSGDDRLVGGSGGDSYAFGAQEPGTDTIVEAPACQDGDQVDFRAMATGVTFDVGREGPQAVPGGAIALPSDTAVENVRGTPVDDTLTGSSCDNVLFGAGGNDAVHGLAGGDTLLGQDGQDTVDGGEGVDVVAQTADADQILTNEVLTGEGPDSLVSIEQASLAGGPGSNRLDASGFTRGSVSLFGGAGNDALVGTRFGDLMDGQAGHDNLRGRGGDDLLKGGEGEDVLIGRRGDDRMVSGTGKDVMRGGSGNDRMNGSKGKDRAVGGSGNDTALGGPGRDRLVGSNGRDRLRGGPGRDRLRARDGRRDIVSGGPGKDRAVVDAVDVLRKVEKTSGQKPGKGKGRTRPRPPSAR